MKQAILPLTAALILILISTGCDSGALAPEAPDFESTSPASSVNPIGPASKAMTSNELFFAPADPTVSMITVKMDAASNVWRENTTVWSIGIGSTSTQEWADPALHPQLYNVPARSSSSSVQFAFDFAAEHGDYPYVFGMGVYDVDVTWVAAGQTYSASFQLDYLDTDWDYSASESCQADRSFRVDGEGTLEFKQQVMPGCTWSWRPVKSVETIWEMSAYTGTPNTSALTVPISFESNAGVSSPTIGVMIDDSTPGYFDGAVFQIRDASMHSVEFGNYGGHAYIGSSAPGGCLSAGPLSGYDAGFYSDCRRSNLAYATLPLVWDVSYISS